MLLWLQPGGQLFRGSGKLRVLGFVLEIPTKLLLENSGLERCRKYEQREHHLGNSVCAKFRLSPPVFLWVGGGINCTYKDVYAREGSWGKARECRLGWEDEEKAGVMWDGDLQSMYSSRDAGGGCVGTETGKNLVLQNLQVPVSGAGRCVSKKNERLRARAWGKDDGQQREW